MYRYVFDGKSALAWELPFFEVYGPPVFHMKVGRPVKCLAQGHNKQTCRLVLHNLPQMSSAKQGSYRYHFLKSFGMTRQGE